MHLELTIDLDLRANAKKPLATLSQRKPNALGKPIVTPVYGNVCHIGLYCPSTNPGTVMGNGRLVFYPAKRMSLSLFSPLSFLLLLALILAKT